MKESGDEVTEYEERKMESRTMMRKCCHMVLSSRVMARLGRNSATRKVLRPQGPLR